GAAGRRDGASARGCGGDPGQGDAGGPGRVPALRARPRAAGRGRPQGARRAGEPVRAGGRRHDRGDARRAGGELKVLATRRYPGRPSAGPRAVGVRPPAGVREPRGDVGGLIVANEPVPLDLLPALRVVANYGVGYDRIDVAACIARDVVVTNTPGVLDEATADLAFALLLAVRRQVVEGDHVVRSGGWHGSWSEGRLAEAVSGSTVGIVG